MSGTDGVEARPWRILHLIDTAGPGGAETVFLNLVRHLPPQRWTSSVVVPWKNDWLHDRLLEDGFRPRVVQSDRPFDLGYLRQLHRIIREVRPDLIQTHLLSTAIYGSAVGRLGRIPTVSTFHGVVDADLERFRALKLRILNRRRGRVVFVSRHLRSWFLSNSPLRKNRTRIVHNGIAFSDAGDRAARAEWRARLGAHDDTVLVGAVGNIRRAKDYATLVQAAARVVASTDMPLRFVVAGNAEGNRRRDLERLRDACGLSGRFRFLGFVPDVAGLLAALDLFVLSSWAEGFSLSTVEAMGAGLPVVVTKSGGPEDIVEDGVTGRMVPPRDPEALAGALRALVGDRDERARLGRAGRVSVRRRFSIDTMIAGYERVYGELLPFVQELQEQQGSRPASHVHGV